MWIPSKVVDWFGLNVANVNMLQSELAAVRAERDGLKLQLAINQNHFDWLRMKVNSLEFERAGFLHQLYGVKTPAPVIERQVQVDPAIDPKNFSFDDVGDEMAKTLGFPIYDTKG